MESTHRTQHATFHISNFKTSESTPEYNTSDVDHTLTTLQEESNGHLLKQHTITTLSADATDLRSDLRTAGFPRSSDRFLAPSGIATELNPEHQHSSHSLINTTRADSSRSTAAGYGSEDGSFRARKVSEDNTTTGRYTSFTGAESSTDAATEQLTAAVSYLTPTTNVTELSHGTGTAVMDDGYLQNAAFHNLTVSPNLLADIPDTNTLSPSDLYDVIVEQFDDVISEEGEEGGVGVVVVAKAATLVFLAVVGVLGNSLVIWSVVRQRALHRPPFYYLLSLSLTDLSRAAFCLPLVLMTLLQGSVWRHGDSACDLFAFANSFFVLSSSLSLLVIAADRHLSLLYPHGYRRRSAGAVNLVSVLLCWTVAFLVSFPPVVGVGAYAFEAGEGQCTLRHRFFFRHHQKNNKSNNNVNNDNDTLGFLLVFSLLLLMTLVIYYRVYFSLRAHRRMRPLEHEPPRSSTWSFTGPGTTTTTNHHAQTFWLHGIAGTTAGNNRRSGGGGAGNNSAPTLPLPAHPFPRNAPNRPPYSTAHALSLPNRHVIRLFFLMTLTFTLLWLPYQALSYWRLFGSRSGRVESGLVTAAAWLSYGQVVVCPVVYFSNRSRGLSSARSSSRKTPRSSSYARDVSPDDPDGTKQHELLLGSMHRQK